MSSDSGRCPPCHVPGRRYWVRISVVNLLAALTVVVVFGGVTTRTPIRDILKSFGIALLFSYCIGPLLALSIPRMSPWLWRRFAFPLNWVAAAAAMVVLAMLGSAVALAVLLGLGVILPAEFALWFLGTLKVSIVITLTFGIFTTAFELMRSRLDEATVALRTKERDEAQARQLAAEAQYASLESRVHPHFLFNTLNSIAALIPHDPVAAERIVGQLASLLRFSLDTQTLVPLDLELQIVRDYLEIERVRFGERLRYRLDVNPAALEALVPRLSVQTLVENSVKYAVSPQREGASIVVAARANGGSLALSVSDDGPGFDPALPDGHGLALLQARLISQFGDAASLSIERQASADPESSRSGGAATWTRVAIEVPLKIGAAVR